MDVAIIGGGAAGYFSAISVKENFPDAKVVIFEKTRFSLAKVKISGGGRCNVTNGNTSISALAAGYPRGKALMKRALRTFNTKHTMAWFESRGVPLFIQDDMRVFPVSQDSSSIINCLLDQAEAQGIVCEYWSGIEAISPRGEQLELSFSRQDLPPRSFDKVIIASGGSPRSQGLEWIEKLGHEIVEPVPSLFTFNMPNEAIVELTGVAVDPVLVSIPGTSLKTRGPLLITHWGFSGPAILKLSAFGARIFNEKDYNFDIRVNWLDQANHELVLSHLNDLVEEHARKLLPNIRPFGLPDRLWRYLLNKSGLPQTKRWSELGKRGLNKLVTVLTNDSYSVSGKTGFKDEFVTCGGVSLDSIDGKSMQSKACENLYFAGEILDIDGITGGYNFQAAWTTAFIAGKLN
ncbi:MAG: NAD(P)/FAD-dependent oxidoreductase [FCB group bacterium]|nr:NAD(P)/FAD-dependent oxidoreductase [FCB group bacterium]MBL7027191.1 NAD(P)/FAD-dependent oxidoreductase [Candidatus Neomarinimicrobiota bacterium]MBL7120574.1 NAD(P)/FAD-dependent oxidoreductase [Candidatus Neomarinimicrobiota bacterium]